ncbi:hypothetical protein TRFO_03032 [Tritrichomonas foetus]|uniref:ubiquitinyl hydrolase 1 n=1 Tax=Tritrichomonas foetus TaxID=1144522 RepID=A0A1J4KYU9_9EUKA|nr:hypothetical protein TRFO_03032 [Tritrichomonas foetus]|eukprot:OHT14757.1 hypothetical protein TRFO_03032 [Tritrichomonas foetus]
MNSQVIYQQYLEFDEEEDITEQEIIYFDKSTHSTFIFTPKLTNFLVLSLNATLGEAPFYSVLDIYIDSKDLKGQVFENRFYLSIRTKSFANDYTTKIPLSVVTRWSSANFKFVFSRYPNELISTGLINPGYICYLNAILQMLYNIPKFRELVFSFPSNETNKNPPDIISSLQRLFAMMSDISSPADARELTESFGWSNDDLFIEQDAHEFLIAFLDKLRFIFSESPEFLNEFDSLFQGIISQNTRKTNSEQSSKDVIFNTLSLEIQKHKNLNQSLYASLCQSAVDMPKCCPKLLQAFDVIKNQTGLPIEYQSIADLLNTQKIPEQMSNENKEQNKEYDQKLSGFIYQIMTKDASADLTTECIKLKNSLHEFISSKQRLPENCHDLLHSLTSIMVNKGYNESPISKQILDFYHDGSIQNAIIFKNKFKKLPKVLIFHLCRFTFTKDGIKKNDSHFEFPLTLDLIKYTEDQKESNYELFSVITHQGELNTGHYYTFSRPTSDKYWFKFNEKNVTLVDENDAINANFGAVFNTPNRSESTALKHFASPIAHRQMNPRSLNQRAISPQQINKTPNNQRIIHDRKFSKSSTAYMLIYLHKDYINDLMNTNVQIPKSLQIYQSNNIQKPKEKYLQPANINFQILTEKEISENIEKDHFCLSKEFNNVKIITLPRSLTTEDLYKEVSKQYNIDTFRLWHCSLGFIPKNILSCDHSSLKNYSYYDSLLYMETGVGPNESNFFGQCKFFILFFNPDSPKDVKYIGVIESNINHIVSSIFPILKEKMNTEKEFDVFCENKPFIAHYLKPELTFCDQKVASGSILIIQFSQAEKYYDFSLIHYPDAQSYTKLANVRPHSVEYYYQMMYNSIDITFHRFYEEKHITLRIPIFLSIKELTKILGLAFLSENIQKNESFNHEIFNKEISENQNHIISTLNQETLKKNNLNVKYDDYYVQFFHVIWNDGLMYPSSTPVDIEKSKYVGNLFPLHSKHTDIFFEIFPQEKLQTHFTHRIEISEDSLIPTKMLQILIPNKATIKQVAGMVEINDLTNYRVLMILNGKIVKQADPNDLITKDYYIIRFDRIQNDQKQILDHKINMIPVFYGVKRDNRVLTFGIPFMFLVKENDNHNSVLERLNQSSVFMKPDKSTEYLIITPLFDIRYNFTIDNLYQASCNNLCLCIVTRNIDVKSILKMQNSCTDRQLRIYT